MEITYLGTATLALRVGSTSLLTDPVFDPRGSAYDFGPWYTPRSWFASEKTYDTPVAADSLGAIDAVLLSHDHHADNLDLAGRQLIADESRVARVLTTVPGASRLARPASAKDAPGLGLGLGARVEGLQPGATARIGPVTISATIARHGPSYAPQAHEVLGFVLDVEHGPRLWISGDTVFFPALASALTAIRKQRPIDVAIVHAGGVAFPSALGFRNAHFTFTASEALEACRILDPRLIVPVHRSGWAHFRESEASLQAAFEGSEFAERTRFLGLGETLVV